jgi:two-component system, NtrC family, sensor kinase
MIARSLRVTAVLAVLASMAVVWVYLFLHSQAVDGARQNAALGMIKDLSRLDADWSADVLRTDADINRTYDPLTRPIPVFSRLLTDLERDATRLGDAGLKQSLEALWAAVDAKTSLIERFKAQNSLLKNSLRYVPTANAEIQGLMRGQREAGLAESSRLVRDVPGSFDGLEKAIRQAGGAGEGLLDASVAKAMSALRASVGNSRRADAATRGAVSYMNLEGAVSALISESLRFSASPEQTAAEALEESAKRLQAVSGDYAPAVRESVHNLVLHVDAIRRLRVAQRELLAEISRLPLASKLDALGTGFTARFEAELHEQATFTRALLWYSAATLLVVFGCSALIAWRHRTERRRLQALVQQQTRELRDNEAQLLHAQKMTTLGETVASIAHEINTPLATVKSGLQSIRDLLAPVRNYVAASSALVANVTSTAASNPAAQGKPSTPLATSLQRVETLRQELQSTRTLDSLEQLSAQGASSVEHIHQVVVGMLDFSRVDRARTATIPIEESIERALQMAGPVLAGTAVVKRYRATAPVRVDVAQINQLVLNLITNAAQAVVPGRGEIRIETAMRDAHQLTLRVIDNGAGIARDALERIWEPFFTTRQAGAGTGLGLCMVKRIADAHGGSIDVESVVGAGTAFTLTLPVAAAQQAQLGEMAEVPDMRSSRAALA